MKQFAIKLYIITKTFLQKVIQCEKFAYLDIHFPHLKTPKSAEQQAVLERGTNVGILARNLYKDGIDISQNRTVWGSALLERTQFALMNGESVLYEPLFESSDGSMRCQPDIFVKAKKRTIVIEVKSSTSIKIPQHIYDVAIQYYVLKSAGYLDKTTEIYIAYLNNEYVLDGELDLNKLFTLENVTSQAKLAQPLIKRFIDRTKTIINRPNSPVIEIGEHCLKPYPCPFKEHCWKDVPNASVLELGGMRHKKRFELYSRYKNSVELPRNATLTEKQWIELDASNTNQVSVNKRKLREDLNALELDKSIFFMDFESFMPAIPKFQGTRPYQQIVFQYCVLYRKDLNSELELRELLAEPGNDPRREFIENLLKDTAGEGNIIVYNENFEITRLKELAELFPEYAGQISERISRTKDLMVPFADKSYYHPSFKGKHKLKTVLPVLCPELSYNSLDISNGAMAMNKYEMFENLTLKEQLETKIALKKYCYMDVYGMVRIAEELQKIAND